MLNASIIGFSEFQSKKNGKFYVNLFCTYVSDKVSGTGCTSVLCEASDLKDYKLPDLIDSEHTVRLVYAVNQYRFAGID